jgi:3-hydroxyisobutyrate dehydrogenase-like beta-hydroxyacid dehydrogenase
VSGRWVIIGFGEVALTLVGGDVLGGARPTILLPGTRAISPASRARLVQSGCHPVRDVSAVANAEVVISAVTPGAALDVAESIAPHLATGSLYVDVNSISGASAERIGEVIAGAAARFVDAAFMGAVPLLRAKVPIFISGPGALAFVEIARPFGLDLTVLSDRAGDASSVKMLWSVVSKGAIALVAEALVAAERLGLTAPLLGLLEQELGRTGSEAMVHRMLESTARAGERRVDEMRAVRSTLASAGVPALMVDATIDWITMLSSVERARGARSARDVVRVLAEDLPRLPA